MRDDQGKYLTPKDVARRLRLSPRTILRMVRRGELPEPNRLNQRVLRWRRETFDQQIDDLRRKKGLK